MLRPYFIYLILQLLPFYMVAQADSTNSPLALSQALLLAAKREDTTVNLEEKLQNISLNNLSIQLVTNDDKKAFWLNIYNAFIILSLKKDPTQYKHRNRFFSKKQIPIAHHTFSFDDIEHGILRRSKIKWGLGYLNTWFPKKIEQQLRVDSVDYRIHFALNCGAKSCPPIAFYSNNNLNKQLALATNTYLQNEVSFDSTKNTVTIPKLMSWFRGDFGGRKKILEILKVRKLIPADSNPKIKYAPYNWELAIANFN
jgi:hypothetical protein